MNYKSFSKDQFEFYLIKYKEEILTLRYWREVSDKVQTNDFIIQEYVYCFETTNQDVSILVFSSVAKSSEKSRVRGSDAVRLVCRWKTKSGVKHKKICKHYRIETLFKNLRVTLNKIPLDNLNGFDNSDWKPSLSEVLNPKLEVKGSI
jgi:hypothetical protein